jgi:hypothetical protein
MLLVWPVRKFTKRDCLLYPFWLSVCASFCPFSVRPSFSLPSWNDSFLAGRIFVKVFFGDIRYCIRNFRITFSAELLCESALNFLRMSIPFLLTKYEENCKNVKRWGGWHRFVTVFCKEIDLIAWALPKSVNSLSDIWCDAWFICTPVSKICHEYFY